MLRLANISKKLQEMELYGIVPVRYANGSIKLYVTHPRQPYLYAWNTRWTEDEDPGKQRLRMIECSIPQRLVSGGCLNPFIIGKDTYLLPEHVFDRITSSWKNIDFR